MGLGLPAAFNGSTGCGDVCGGRGGRVESARPVLRGRADTLPASPHPRAADLRSDAAPTWKRTYGHPPPTGFVGYGPGGTGEPVVSLLRPGNPGSNTVADHITAAQLALAQPPKKYRRGRQPLIRTDSAGGIRDVVACLAQDGGCPTRWAR